MAHTNWYRYGTISINQDSNHVIGLNTRWADIGIKSGDIFTLDGLKIYEVDTVTDNANLTLKTAFEESSAADVHYCIIRNFTDISTADIVAQMSELQVEMKNYIDTEMSTLKGKSAYELAQDNGFTGTEPEWLASLNAYGVAKKGGYTGTQEEWLESLKAAGEWSNANTRLTTLEGYNANNRLTALEKKTVLLPTDGVNANAMPVHNLFPRFKKLGSEITAAQYAAIANGSYNDLYIGDKWVIPMTILGEERNCTFTIIQCGVGEIYKEVNGERKLDYYTDCLFLKLTVPGLESKFKNSKSDANVSYAQSIVKTETLPAILETLESFFGAEHILKWDFRSFLFDSKEQYEKINLFKLDEISYYQYSTPGRTEPYELFTHGIIGYWRNPMNTNTLLQDTNGDKVYTYHWSTGKILSCDQYADYEIEPYFVLVP